jgi:murein DD-endopeptidase MepM/ murein hydrolase activator NlpD
VHNSSFSGALRYPFRVQPLVRGAIVVAALSALTRAAESERVPEPSGAEIPAHSDQPLSSQCPAGTLPDRGVCIPVPLGPRGGDELLAQENAHRDRSGAWRSYEQIPRRPERPSDYRRYRLPVPPLPGQSFVVSGYDLDLPDAEQRRGPELKAVGHGGIDIAQKRGTAVRLVALEHQVGDAEVVHVGSLFGTSVMTRHAVREGGRLREYIVIHGHLDATAPGIRRGSNAREGTLLGFVGDSGSPGAVHLHLEVRRVRDGVDALALVPGLLIQSSKSVVCDPRNVLPFAAR